MALKRKPPLSEYQAERLAKFTPDQIELHKQVMKQIEAEPERWDQKNWIFSREIQQARHDAYMRGGRNAELDFETQIWDVNRCGTTMCYAGWAALLSGYQFQGDGRLIDEGGETHFPAALARNLLGLTYSEGEQIFDSLAARTPEQMKATVTRVTGIEFD